MESPLVEVQHPSDDTNHLVFTGNTGGHQLQSAQTSVEVNGESMMQRAAVDNNCYRRFGVEGGGFQEGRRMPRSTTGSHQPSSNWTDL